MDYAAAGSDSSLRNSDTARFTRICAADNTKRTDPVDPSLLLPFPGL